MPPISFRAIVIAFGAEIVVDTVIQGILSALFGHGLMTSGMSSAELERVSRQVLETTAFLPWAFAFGTATTIGGAYLAARIAKVVPYYHGLAIGVVGVLFVLTLWPDDAGWVDWLGLLLTIPVSLYGAHLAKLHMSAVE